jgi:hypothetical protein
LCCEIRGRRSAIPALVEAITEIAQKSRANVRFQLRRFAINQQGRLRGNPPRSLIARVAAGLRRKQSSMSGDHTGQLDRELTFQ